MYTTDAPVEIDNAILATLAEKIADFVENAHPDLASATLRVADVEIDRRLREDYGVALRNELCYRFRERLYFVSITDYVGRNGRRFADVLIEMKRGLLI